MVLIDSNVLVYALNSDAPHHGPSRRVVEFGLSGGFKAVLLPQVVVETYAILTDARRVSRPLEPEVAWAQIVALRRGFETLPWLPEGLELLGKLIETHKLGGQRVFDAVLASQLLAHNVGRLCTYNIKDFLPYSGIQALTPEQLLSDLG